MAGRFKRGRDVSRSFRIIRDFITGAALLIFGVLIAARLNQQPASSSPETIRGAFRVSDGDTLSLNGKRYRLKGIDAPERAQTCGASDARWACGDVARDGLSRLVAGGGTVCHGDEQDRYGRLLVVCKSGEVDLNGRMIEDGLAIAYPSRGVDYRGLEARARQERRGLWSGPFDRPQDWRRVNGDVDGGGLRLLVNDVLRFFGFERQEEDLP